MEKDFCYLILAKVQQFCRKPHLLEYLLMDIHDPATGLGFSLGAILRVNVNLNVKYIGYTQRVDNLTHLIFWCQMLS